jgi:hypothetical protein
MTTRNGGLEAVRRQAADRHGLFTLSDLDAVGVKPHVLAHRLRSGEWERVHRGVFRIAGVPESFSQRLHAAVLFGGPGAHASHRAAARLWGWPGFGREGVEVSKPRGRSQRRKHGVVHGSTLLPEEHCTTRDDIPVTTAARTVFDLAAVVHPRRLERALDNALARKYFTIGEVHAVLATLGGRGRSGTVVMRKLLAVRSEGYVAPSSELEAVARALLAEAGLPEPLVERNLGDDRDWIGRVDLLYPTVKLVIELDSFVHHSQRLDRRSDRRRNHRLKAAGWEVMRFDWWDLVDTPAEFVQEVRHVLLARSA